MPMPGLGINASDKVNKILGNTGYQQQAGFRAQGLRTADAGYVARKIEQLLASLREVESASGTILVKVQGAPPKKVSFR